MKQGFFSQRKINKEIKAGENLFEAHKLRSSFDLYHDLTLALDADDWRAALNDVLQKHDFADTNEDSEDELLSILRHEIQKLRHTLDTSLDKDEIKDAATEFKDKLESQIDILTKQMLAASDQQVSKNKASDSEDTPSPSILEPMSRTEFFKKSAWIGLGAAVAPALYHLWKKNKKKMSELSEKFHEKAYEHPASDKVDPVLLTDSLATAYFTGKVYKLVKGDEVGKNDYYTAIGFLAARCLLGGKEVTHHTVEELKFGFESAALAIGLGFAAEGVSAQLPEILNAIKGENPTRPQVIASIAAAGSVVSPLALTIGSSSAFGDEVRKLATENGVYNKKALGVLLSHLGDHSALGAGFYSDPPDIPMAKLVGMKNMIELKAVYGQVPAIWSLFSTVFKTNYLLNEDQDEDRFKKSMKDTLDGLSYVMPVLPVFMAHSLKNIGMYTFQQPQSPKGAKFDIMSRLGEATHNLYEMTMKKNPDSRKVFSEYHEPVSDLIQKYADSTTAYAQGKMDPHAKRIEELLDGMAAPPNLSPISALIEKMISPKIGHGESVNILCTVWDQIELALPDQEDKAKELKAQAHALWLVSDTLHRQEDHPVDNIYSLASRMTEKARLADAFGHGQMDVLTLLPWQILLSVPISNVLKYGLETVVDSGMPPVVTTMANMGLTGAVTGTVDNLAAFLASANASIKAKQPRLMEALMASIAFGSATWAGNPIAHGKIASSTTHPPYGIPESISTMPWNTDVYTITTAWTMLMNKMDMEQRILGDEHPMLKTPAPSHDEHENEADKHASNVKTDERKHTAHGMDRRDFFGNFKLKFS